MTRLLSLLLLAVLSGCGVTRSTTDRALQRMDQQARYDIYESSSFFRNGMTMQTPPAGTVARDAVLDPPLASGRDRSGGYLTHPPIDVSSETLDLGRSRFRIYCAVCHGAAGFGGSIVASNLSERRPPSLRSPAVSSLPAGFFFEVISRGLGRMPSYAAELPVEQRWAVVAYLQRLQRRAGATSPDEKADSIRGAELRAEDSLRQAQGDTLR